MVPKTATGPIRTLGDMQQLLEFTTGRPMTAPELQLMVLGDGGTGAHDLGRAIAAAIDTLPGAVPVIDVWADGRAAVERNVVSLPTTIAEIDGREIGRLVGPTSHRRLRRFVDGMTSTARPAGGR